MPTGPHGDSCSPCLTQHGCQPLQGALEPPHAWGSCPYSVLPQYSGIHHRLTTFGFLSTSLLHKSLCWQVPLARGVSYESIQPRGKRGLKCSLPLAQWGLHPGKGLHPPQGLHASQIPSSRSSPF